MLNEPTRDLDPACGPCVRILFGSCPHCRLLGRPPLMAARPSAHPGRARGPPTATGLALSRAGDCGRGPCRRRAPGRGAWSFPVCAPRRGGFRSQRGGLTRHGGCGRPRSAGAPRRSAPPPSPSGAAGRGRARPRAREHAAVTAERLGGCRGLCRVLTCGCIVRIGPCAACSDLTGAGTVRRACAGGRPTAVWPDAGRNGPCPCRDTDTGRLVRVPTESGAAQPCPDTDTGPAFWPDAGSKRRRQRRRHSTSRR